MPMLLENRTISMILTVPHVKELSHSVLKNSKPPSIPIYQGSIIHIEQHRDNQNTSDLIVRVPNFQHVSLPSVTISINDDQSGEIEGQRIKRRAPICPIRNKITNFDDSNFNQSGLTNTKRLAIGLRNLRQIIRTNCQSKRSNAITIIPVLPDVEIITEDFQVPTLEKKTNKNPNSTSKFFISKILFIKRKHFKTKKKQPSSVSIDTEGNVTNENSLINETESIKLNDEGKNTNQQSPTIAQLIPNIPISLINPESSADTDDTYSECYEITYQFDPEFQNQSSIKLNLNPFEYQDLTPWMPSLPSNKYEQIHKEVQNETNLVPRVKFQSFEDLSQISHDQTSTYQPESISGFSSSQENNQIICLNNTPIINEDYTVILQFLRYALQIESNADDDDDYNEFNKQIKEIFQTDKINELK